MFFNACDLLGLNALFRLLHRGQVKVLLYHSIAEPGGYFNNAVSPEEFKRQLQHLKAHYNVVSLDGQGEFVGYRADRVNVLITFDDGFVDNFHVAAKLLRSAQLPATFFLIAACTHDGSPPRFVLNRLSAGEQAPAEASTMTVAQAQSLLREGMVIGSHGMHHIDYRQAAQGEGLQDATLSGADLQQSLGVPVATFAFPWGRHLPGQPQALLSTYAKVFLTSHGFNARGDRVLHRNEVADLAQMRAACSGVLDFFSGLLAPAKAIKGLSPNKLRGSHG
jgi:peptidoglycan/xylan/chitin deacetylase (PgdA/CDA1 family)